MTDLDARILPSVTTGMGYLPAEESEARYLIYPPSTGRRDRSPPRIVVDLPIHDCRPVARELAIDVAGFTLRELAPPAIDYLDKQAVKARYYPAIAELVRATAGAAAAFVFDHNVRSVAGAAAGRPGVRAPVGDAHDDYTEASGPRRVQEVLAAAGRDDLIGRRAAIINAWRPLRGPVQDWPLAVCDARTVEPIDFIPCAIDHYAEDDLSTPNHSGEIYSMHFSPRHRWFYVADMGPTEVLVFKCYDSSRTGVSRFTPHGGFANPACPPEYLPRESIEARVVVVYPEADRNHAH